MGEIHEALSEFPLNLITTVAHYYYKKFIVLNPLEQYRSTWVTIDYEVSIGNEYLLSPAMSSHVYHVYYNYNYYKWYVTYN